MNARLSPGRARQCKPAPRAGIAFALALPLFACGEETPAPADATAETTLCERDDLDTPDTALGLAPIGAGEVGTTGMLCPVGDVDWYRFDMPADHHLLRVRLAMDGDLSPVEPTYVVWSTDAGAPLEVLAATPPIAIGFPVDEVHCVAPGPLLVAIRDDGQDGEDIRRTYSLAVTSSRDTDASEPNDSAATATPLASDGSAIGAIACTGDTDWFTFESGTGRIARVVFDMPIAPLTPLVRLQHADGDLVATRTNPAAATGPTQLILETVLPRAGRYFVVIGDDDGKNAAPDAAYTLTLTLLDDSDPNEPNGHPDTATPLSATAVTCSGDWSSWVESTGNIGSIGDNDWFALPVACSSQGLVEAEVVMLTDNLSGGQREALARDVQIALTFTRSEPGSPCGSDLACQALTKVCDSEWDCSGLGNTCLPDGFCAGSGVCLPSGACGADVVQRRFEPGDTAATTAHRASLTAPLFGDSVVSLRVADFQSNGAARGITFACGSGSAPSPTRTSPTTSTRPRSWPTPRPTSRSTQRGRSRFTTAPPTGSSSPTAAMPAPGPRASSRTRTTSTSSATPTLAPARTATCGSTMSSTAARSTSSSASIGGTTSGLAASSARARSSIHNPR